jgi:alcohol dehydrogenase/L-iditol 2-dehydrogenase
LPAGINIPGLLRERAAVPVQFAWTAPEGLADQDLVCVEPMTVALHAARLGNALPGHPQLRRGRPRQILDQILTPCSW